MRRTREEAEKTRTEIAHCALRTFATKGYAATRLDDIAEEAGVTRGAVYFHFGDKAGLYRAALEAPSKRLGDVMQHALTGDKPVSQRLEHWFMAVLELAARDEEVRASLEIQWLRTEALDEFAQDMEAKRTRTVELIRMLSELIRQGVADGDLGHTESPTAIATGLIALLTGLLQGWILDRSMPLVRRGRIIVRTYLLGMGR